VSVFPLLVIVHALAATVWTGGHLVLDLGVLPRALRAQSAAQVRAFEEVFEPLGLTALVIQVLTGLGMGWIYLPGFRGLFSTINPIGMLWQSTPVFTEAMGVHEGRFMAVASFQIHQLELHCQAHHFLNALGDFKRALLRSGAVQAFAQVLNRLVASPLRVQTRGYG
jgi:uncharacterized membrane protein